MGLRKILDNVEHHFQEGGKLEKWYALYEVFDTFLYSPSSVTRTTAHVRDGVDLKRIMICRFPGHVLRYVQPGFPGKYHSRQWYRQHN